ncbi:hypothetical protein CVT25_009417 [Psilocybe cyanescens]|uniref:RING-type domain-containing protein n=1 Tax=Psilocybe cyanescens TaxID=93625 RepID=A0A409WW09_PSICY|nr:hypothetical protein CVT25_009417 [Psilocybe cyanescens]
MHFSKTYAQLLLSLPPELRDNAIEYRQLKKIINQIVNELSGLGLKPAILHELIEAQYQASTSSSSSAVDDGHGLASGSGSGSGSAAFSTRAAASVPLVLKLKDQQGAGEDDAGSTSTSANPLPSDCDDHEGGNTSHSMRLAHPRVVYELNSTSGKIEPQLRIWMGVPQSQPEGSGSGVQAVTQEMLTPESLVTTTRSLEDDVHVAGIESADGDAHEEEERDQDGGHANLLWALQQRHFKGERIIVVDEAESAHVTEHGDGSLHDSFDEPDDSSSPSSSSFSHPDHTTSTTATPTHPPIPMREIIIPLIHDTEFFNLLSTKLGAISTHLASMHAEFSDSLEELARMIADAAHPASAAAGFRPNSSVEMDAGGGVRVRIRGGDLKSDLYFWREIFQMYVEAEVFESVSEASRGERSVEESERRLRLFAQRATQQGLMGDAARRKLKLRQSREALERFLRMNLVILDIKKFSHANSEATRKILKKHTKRTALFYPGLSSSLLSPSSASASTSLALQPQPQLPTSPFALARILVQALGTTLLPVIPSLEDYSCLICTSIAFKPIRLDCGHLFCVRCLVKMQKRGKGECPCCRRWCVLDANRKNVDWALLNFMQDWFPVEAREKMKQNEKEAAEEEMRELGIDPDKLCVIM